MTKSNQSSLDIADHLSRGEYDWCPEAETRLREQHDFIRQQHAEIEALKKEAALQRLSDFTQEAEHEPVAWLWTKDGKPQSALLHEPDTVPSDPYWKDKGFKAIPLYLHPVKELHLSLQKSKQTGELLAVTYTDDEHRIVEVLWQRPPELTDEEIMSEWEESKDEVEFARAILRKAQEK